MLTSPIIPAVDNVFVTDNVDYVTIAGLPAEENVLPRLFGLIADAGIKLDLITQIAAHTNKMGVSFSLDDADFMRLSPILKTFKKEFKDIVITASTGNTKISVFGQKMNEYVGVAKALFDILNECHIEPKVISTSETDISILMNEMNEDEVVGKLKETFEL